MYILDTFNIKYNFGFKNYKRVGSISEMYFYRQLQTYCF